MHALHLKNVKEWELWCQTGARPRHIPSNPTTSYKHDGWQGYGYWLGWKVAQLPAKISSSCRSTRRCCAHALSSCKRRKGDGRGTEAGHVLPPLRPTPTGWAPPSLCASSYDLLTTMRFTVCKQMMLIRSKCLAGDIRSPLRMPHPTSIARFPSATFIHLNIELKASKRVFDLRCHAVQRWAGLTHGDTCHRSVLGFVFAVTHVFAKKACRPATEML